MASSQDLRLDPSAGIGGVVTAGLPASSAGSAFGPSGREVTDEELVQRMREGESAAGETLCRRYHTPLFRYLQRLCRSDHLAEELHQQAWVSVLEHLDRFDPASSPGGFKAWLFRIATNKANDLWRSKGRENVAKEGFKRVVEREGPSASAAMQGAEDVDRLRREIDRLPEPQKQVLMLRYYSGMRFVEIAQVLGCPLNTALGRMHKAVMKLKAAMDS